MTLDLAPDHGEEKTVRAGDVSAVASGARTDGASAGNSEDNDDGGLSEGSPKSNPHGRLIGRAKGRITAKLPAVIDSQGRPITHFVTAGQASDEPGASGRRDKLAVGDAPIVAVPQIG